MNLQKILVLHKCELLNLQSHAFIITCRSKIYDEMTIIFPNFLQNNQRTCNNHFHSEHMSLLTYAHQCSKTVKQKMMRTHFST